jgi:hypothetical protein
MFFAILCARSIVMQNNGSPWKHLTHRRWIMMYNDIAPRQPVFPFQRKAADVGFPTPS